IPEKRVPHFKPGKALREAVDFQPHTDKAVPAATTN
ncbi:MAG TPA: integration host factor subunit beta, partial [Comamonas sp.]